MGVQTKRQWVEDEKLHGFLWKLEENLLYSIGVDIGEDYQGHLWWVCGF